MRTYFSLPSGIGPPRPLPGLITAGGASPDHIIASGASVSAVSDYRSFLAAGLFDLTCPEVAGRDHLLVRLSVVVRDELVVSTVAGDVWHFRLAAPERVRALRVPEQFPLWPVVKRARGFAFDDAAIIFPPSFVRASVPRELERRLGW